MRLFTGQGKSDFSRLARLLCLMPLLFAACLPAKFCWSQQQPASRSIWNTPAGQASSTNTPTNSSQRYSEGIRPQIPASEYYPPANQASGESGPTPAARYREQPAANNPSAQPFPVPTIENRSAAKSQIELTSGQLPVQPAASQANQQPAPQQLAPQQLIPAETAREIPTQKSEPPIPLSRNGSSSADGEKTPARSVGSGSQLALTMLVLLGIVGLILGLAKVLKKHNPLLGAVLPGSVIELLGRRMIDQRHAVHFIRIGERILVVGASMDGLRTLAEITDPVEIDRISGECRVQSVESNLTRSFRMLLSREQTEPVNSQSDQIDPYHSNNQRSQSSPERNSTRKRAEKKRFVEADPAPTFSWETPDHGEDSGITAEDIASLTRTLEAARERRES